MNDWIINPRPTDIFYTSGHEEYFALRSKYKGCVKLNLIMEMGLNYSEMLKEEKAQIKV